VGFTMVFRNGAREFRVPATVSQGTFERIVTNGRPTEGPIAVTAIVTPRVRVNAERPDRGAFESIPMVAPYVEFLYDLDVKSVMPAPPADATVPANPGAPAGNAPAR
jgi:Lon protease-like protein